MCRPRDLESHALITDLLTMLCGMGIYLNQTSNNYTFNKDSIPIFLTICIAILNFSFLAHVAWLLKTDIASMCNVLKGKCQCVSWLFIVSPVRSRRGSEMELTEELIHHDDETYKNET